MAKKVVEQNCRGRKCRGRKCRGPKSRLGQHMRAGGVKVVGRWPFSERNWGLYTLVCHESTQVWPPIYKSHLRYGRKFSQLVFSFSRDDAIAAITAKSETVPAVFFVFAAERVWIRCMHLCKQFCKIVKSEFTFRGFHLISAAAAEFL